jgi:hypothetical protein
MSAACRQGRLVGRDATAVLVSTAMLVAAVLFSGERAYRAAGVRGGRMDATRIASITSAPVSTSSPDV